ncbi:Uncharacterised protein [Candidatus Venteria ishoeyi]|uniref:Uncharacterized protein n=1 Tax=Candidatus Venteria ishoeyi TaxID=1899563 RepID=A0A1H6F8V2_9GAMM|nr:Uncharacterised protein [Candidatus Venteria ishoeyi]
MMLFLSQKIEKMNILLNLQRKYIYMKMQIFFLQKNMYIRQKLLHIQIFE